MTLTDMTDEISPFPSAGNLLQVYQDSPEIEFRSQLSSPQKLRPIRSTGNLTDEFSDSTVVVCDDVVFPENGGGFVVGNLVYDHNPDEMVCVASPAMVTDVKSQMLPPPLPIQKLRPIRSSSGDKEDSCYCPVNLIGGELQERDGGAGNRWPEAETLALLRIRSEMDVEFRVSNPKGPLWEIVSRKLEEMGYHRDSKKCREKFENVYKYYKRTKERLPGGVGSQGGKIYKFFSELKALDHQYDDNNNNPISETSMQDNNTTTQNHPDPLDNPSQLIAVVQTNSTDLSYPFGSDDDSEDYNGLNEEIVEPVNGKRKREDKLEIYFENLMNKVMKKQEIMYNQVIKVIERKEKDRIMREEAWKQQEMERMKRDEELRAQENSRSLALISFIEKYLGQQIHVQHSPESSYLEDKEEKLDQSEYKFDPNNRRWPKHEVQALISLRISMENTFQGTASRGSLWEGISQSMSSMGYSRSAKKCKEKWENINKYFKKAKDSGKNRSENAKTCPYFRELDILYKNRLAGLENSPKEVKVEHVDRSANDEILTTLAQVCNLFSLSEALEPAEGQSSPPRHDFSVDTHASNI